MGAAFQFYEIDQFAELDKGYGQGGERKEVAKKVSDSIKKYTHYLEKQGIPIDSLEKNPIIPDIEKDAMLNLFMSWYEKLEPQMCGDDAELIDVFSSLFKGISDKENPLDFSKIISEIKKI